MESSSANLHAPTLTVGTFAWGSFWWFRALAYEIGQRLAGDEWAAGMLGFLVVSTAVCASLRTRTGVESAGIHALGTDAGDDRGLHYQPVACDVFARRLGGGRVAGGVHHAVLVAVAFGEGVFEDDTVVPLRDPVAWSVLGVTRGPANTGRVFAVTTWSHSAAALVPAGMVWGLARLQARGSSIPCGADAKFTWEWGCFIS